MPEVAKTILEFAHDPKVEAAIVSKWNASKGRELPECPKDELLEIADGLMHLAHFCIATAESKA